jgi:hypothetical protein
LRRVDQFQLAALITIKLIGSQRPYCTFCSKFYILFIHKWLNELNGLSLEAFPNTVSVA